ncbi:major capsid protein [Enterobacter hormaechei]|jgi:hypothetical protein|nr:hypothetical protein [Escherichia coli]MEA3773439.1 major capsid protein [Enterobacter hormaechei]
MSIKKKVTLVALAAVSAVAAPSVMAAEGTSKFDLTALTGAIDFGDVGTAILGIAAAVAGLYALFAGVKHVLRMVRSA